LINFERSNRLSQLPAYRTQSGLKRFRTSLVQSKTGLIGLFIVLLVAACAVFAPFISSADPTAQKLTARLVPPIWQSGDRQYLLGTDSLGRDMLSRIIYGSRISLVVGTSAMIIGGTLGTVVGLLSGYYEDRVGLILMRFADIQLAIPELVLYIAIMAALGPGLRNLILGLGITSWVVYARVVRSEVLGLKNMEFITASQSIGARDVRILFVHVLPNVIMSDIVIATIQVAGLILAEAGLSFLGLGVPPPTPTWGGMVADGRDYLEPAWWVSTLPGLAILVTVLGINLFGDWLRDYLDPRLRG
jgi:peptide/nickel transport system permease protein